jgi:multiple antibiotic resistance protein
LPRNWQSIFRPTPKAFAKEIEARLSSWDKEKLVLVHEFLQQEQSKEAPSEQLVRAVTDASWAAVEAATRAETRATTAIVISVAAMLAAVASAVVAFLGLKYLGALILELYGILIPVLRVSGGLIVAGGGWKLLSDGSQKELDASQDGVSRTNPLDQAFYPLTLPLTTGPGTIAVVISLGLSRASYTNATDDLLFVIESLLAVVVIAITIFFCFAYADRVQRLRLSAFILFCLGIQILWSGGSELLRSVIHSGS